MLSIPAPFRVSVSGILSCHLTFKFSQTVCVEVVKSWHGVGIMPRSHMHIWSEESLKSEMPSPARTSKHVNNASM